MPHAQQMQQHEQRPQERQTWQHVVDFPYLAEDEFEHACCQLRCDASCFSAPSRGRGLSMTRTFPLPDTFPHEKSPCEEQEVCEDDPEVMEMERESKGFIRVHYDIILSPTYRVPVVYLTASVHPDTLPAPSLRHLYTVLVSQSHRDSMSEAGVMGALTMTDHLVSGMPAYFVHPCRTADAMRAIAQESKIGALQYMLLWFGVIGSSVGLSVPVDLAMKMGVGV